MTLGLFQFLKGVNKNTERTGTHVVFLLTIYYLLMRWKQVYIVYILSIQQLTDYTTKNVSKDSIFYPSDSGDKMFPEKKRAKSRSYRGLADIIT